MENLMKTKRKILMLGMVLIVQVIFLLITGTEVKATTSTDGLKYEIINGNEIIIKGYVNKNIPKEVTIPSEIVLPIPDGTFSYKVTTIDEYAFDGCTKITSIEIPDTVTTIGDYAFSSCSALNSIKLPISLKVINEGTFHNCINLKEITIPETINKIEASAFQDCVCLEKVKFPNSSILESIESNAFDGCIALKEINLQDNLQRIGQSAFLNCIALKEITIPQGVIKIGDYALGYNSDKKLLNMNYEIKYYYNCTAMIDYIKNVKIAKDNAGDGTMPKFIPEMPDSVTPAIIAYELTEDEEGKEVEKLIPGNRSITNSSKIRYKVFFPEITRTLGNGFTIKNGNLISKKKVGGNVEFIWGDANADGKVDAIDALIILQYSVGKIKDISDISENETFKIAYLKSLKLPTNEDSSINLETDIASGESGTEVKIYGIDNNNQYYFNPEIFDSSKMIDTVYEKWMGNRGEWELDGIQSQGASAFKISFINHFNSLNVYFAQKEVNVYMDKYYLIDVNMDGIINASDALEILQYSTGKIKKFSGEFNCLETGAYYEIDVEVNGSRNGSTNTTGLMLESGAFVGDSTNTYNVGIERTITIDNKAPKLEGIKIFTERFNQNIDASEVTSVNNNLRMRDIVKIELNFDESLKQENIPAIILEFEKSGEKRIDEGRIEGNKIIYEYTIKNTDEGALSIKDCIGYVYDLANNKEELTLLNERTLTQIKSDNSAPKVKKVEILDDAGETLEKGTYPAGTLMQFKVTFDENVYQKNESKLENYKDGKLNIIIGNSREVVTFTEYGENKKELIFKYVVNEDKNGKVIVGGTTNIYDIAGNGTENNAYTEIFKDIIIDTKAPKAQVTIKAHPINNGYSNLAEGSTIDIIVKIDEEVTYNEKSVQIKFGGSIGKGELSEGTFSDKEITFKYTVASGDNGKLSVIVPDDTVKDNAKNPNAETLEDFENNAIIADTKKPTYDSENPNKFQITATSSQVAGTIEFEEEIVVKGTAEVLYTRESGNTYSINIAEVSTPTKSIEFSKGLEGDSTEGNIKAVAISGGIYDKAGNQYGVESGDITPPKLKNIEITSTKNKYKDGKYYNKKDDTITITAIYDEELNTQTTTSLIVKIGEDEVNITNGKIEGNTIIYTYKITDSTPNGEMKLQKYEVNVSDKKSNSRNICLETETLNSLQGTNSQKIIVDTINPIAKIKTTTSSIVEGTKTNKTEITYSITPNENITENTLTIEDLEIINGTLSDYEYDTKGNLKSIVVKRISDGEQQITIKPEKFTDIAGNKNTTSTFVLIIDTASPYLVFTETNGGETVLSKEGKATIQTSINSNEKLKELKYIWAETKDLPEDNARWINVSTEEIGLNSNIPIATTLNKEGTIYLHVKAIDEAQNIIRITSNAFKINKRKVIGLEIITQPNKMEYIEGETFDSLGMVLKATYNDGTEETVNNYTVEKTTPLSTRDTEVRISYLEKEIIVIKEATGEEPAQTQEKVTKVTTTQAIRVLEKEVTGIEVTTQPRKIEYIEEENFDASAMIVKATYNDGTSKNVTGYTTDKTKLALTDKAVTISYTEGGKTVTTTQTIKVVAKNGSIDTPSNPIQPEEPANQDIITSTIYTIGETYITKIQPQTTKADFIKNITKVQSTSTITIKNGTTEVTDTRDIMCTGMTIKVTYGTNKTKEFTLVVYGDLNKDGNADIKDMFMLNRHRLNRVTLKEEQIKAGDINNDGFADIHDIFRINKYRIGRIEKF